MRGAGGKATAPAERRAEHRCLQRARSGYRQYQRQPTLLTTDLNLERRATRTAIYVRAGHAAGQDPIADRGQSLANLRAGAVSRRPAPYQRFAGLEYERLHLLSADTQDGRDLLVG